MRVLSVVQSIMVTDDLLIDQSELISSKAGGPRNIKAYPLIPKAGCWSFVVDYKDKGFSVQIEDIYKSLPHRYSTFSRWFEGKYF